MPQMYEHHLDTIWHNLIKIICIQQQYENLILASLTQRFLT